MAINQLIKNQRIDDRLFKKMVTNLPICTVDVLFFDQTKKKIILFKRVNKPLKDIYFSIGGRLFKNESLEDGAVRIAKEELKIKLNKNKLIPGGFINEIYLNSIYKGINYHSVDIYWGYMLNTTLQSQIKLDRQHSKFKWFSVSNKNFHPIIKEMLKNLLPKL